MGKPTKEQLDNLRVAVLDNDDLYINEVCYGKYDDFIKNIEKANRVIEAIKNSTGIDWGPNPTEEV